MPAEWVDGETASRTFQLLKNALPFDATGTTPSLIARDKDGAVVTIAGTVTWESAAQAIVRYAPHANDLDAAKSPYTIHFKARDGAGKDLYAPSEPDRWTIWPGEA